jgi:serine/threonine protein phosphatase PrpC
LQDLDIGQTTDVGRIRESNEDALLAQEFPPRLLIAVADGMGGHAAGEIASATALQALREALPRLGDSARGEALRISVEQANSAVWTAALADPAHEGMGTTLVAALVEPGGRVAIANVGDSRAYLLVDEQARLVTQDHTWVAEQIALGELSEREARSHPYRNVLMRAIGTDAQVEVDLFSDVQLRPGAALALVSDGVTLYLDTPDLARAFVGAASAQEIADRLVGQAVRRGGADNASAVVVWRR